jgi:hypothetical protein
MGEGEGEDEDEELGVHCLTEAETRTGVGRQK